MRKLFSLTVILCLLSVLGWSEMVKVSKENGRIEEQVNIEVIAGGDYISINDVLKIAGGVKYWYPTTNKVLLEINGTPLELYLEHANIRLRNSIQKKLSAPPMIYRSKVVVPLDFLTNIVSSVIGKSINWDREKRMITVDSVEATILSVHYYTYPDRTRIVFETVREYRPKEIKDDGKITYIFRDARVNSLAVSQEIFDRRIKTILARQVKNDVSIEISLSSEAITTKVLYLRNPFRVVIDLNDDETAPGAGVSAKKGTPRQFNHKDVKPPLIVPVKEERPVSPVIDITRARPLKTIVIDPGHGGKDPGALGYSGLKEKTVTLAVAKILKDLIVSRLGLRVILTRNGDYFVPLRERTEIANNNRADLFVSIHVNASLRSRAEGFETYYLGKASNEDARVVAALENAAIKYEKNKKSLSDLDFILWDMAQNDFRSNSFEFANFIQKELDSKLSTENRQVKTAPFYVLNGAYMPAILAELGFITNRKEEKMLKSWKHQKRLAEALYNSIYTYKQRQEKLLGFAKN